MNTEEFTKLTENPTHVLKEQLVSLESVLEEFPYFQAARVIHLKGLKNQRNFKYNNTLKKVAAYTTNRSILFDFITTDVLDYQAVSANESAILNEIEVIDSKVIDHLFESISSANEEKLPIEEKDIDVNVEVKRKEKEEKLEIGTPINFNKDDSYSFNEWLQLTPKKPISRKDDLEKGKKLLSTKKTTSKIANKLDLIEQFILNKPKIQTPKSQKIIDVSIASTAENTNLMTETLARVYLEQKKFDKAISAFKILSLKYPEKSAFFADRIKAIKFLQKHK